MSSITRSAIALLVLTAPASAQTLTDAFGRTITCAAPIAGSAKCTDPSGNIVISPNTSVALSTFGSMAPFGWTPPAEPATTLINPFAFRNRFTTTERQAIITAGRSNSAVQDVYDGLLAAIQVDVSDPVTIAGIQALEAAGVLGAGRAAQVLNLAVASP